MTRMRDWLGVGGLCVALFGCATEGAGPRAAAEPGGAQAAHAQLTLDTPIGQICDDARGRAVLDRTFPDLRKNPNYFLFQGMSLRQLASLSGGEISATKLETVRVGLAAAPPDAPTAAH
jgi:hypothetical protein